MFMCMIVLRKPIDHYKLLPWMCVANIRVNSGSVAICEADGCKVLQDVYCVRC